MAYIYAPSAALFNQAKAARQRIADKAVGEREPRQRDALIAIVFSALTLEGFINELADYAAYPGRVEAGIDPQSVRAVGSILKELEEARSPIQLKLLVARFVFSGETYDKGAQPYQDFKLLIDLRNALAHVKGLDIFELTTRGIQPLAQPPKAMNELESRHITADMSTQKQPWNWVEKLECLATARWACMAASNIIWSLIETIPDSPFAATWRGIYQRFYDMSVPPEP